jgi:cyclohexyl-isocyanide hydratase
MKIVCFMYPGFTALDLVGPVTAWGAMPDVAFEFVASAKGDVLTDSGLTLRATHDFTDFSAAPDVLLVPGGALPTFEALQDDALLDAIARAGEGAAWVTSVCTGALLLGAAGLLRGYRSASHWTARHYLDQFGAIPDAARVVIDRNRASGGGVTAGIDFGLSMIRHWRGEETSKLIELVLEYAPEPPNACGRPELADAATLAQARALTGPMMPAELVRAAARRRGFVAG